MKFLDQAGFTQSRLAYDQHQLPFALPCPIPPAHQHGDFLVPAYKRSEMALSRAATATACPHKPEQRNRLRDAS